MTGHADLDRRIRAGGSDLRRSQRQGASSHNDQRYLLRDLHMHGHFDTGPLQMLNRCAAPKEHSSASTIFSQGGRPRSFCSPASEQSTTKVLAARQHPEGVNEPTPNVRTDTEKSVNPGNHTATGVDVRVWTRYATIKRRTARLPPPDVEDGTRRLEREHPGDIRDQQDQLRGDSTRGRCVPRAAPCGSPQLLAGRSCFVCRPHS